MESEPPPDPSIPDRPVPAQPEMRAAKTPRWLTTRWFWPGYCLLVVVFLLWARPWEAWFGSTGATTVTLTLVIHQGTENVFAGYRQIGTFVMVSDPLPEVLDRWLPCDGRQLDASKYPALFEALGKRQQGADRESGTFRLPDCQGLTAQVPSGLGSWMTTSSLTFEADDGTGPEQDDVQETRVHCFIKAK